MGRTKDKQIHIGEEYGIYKIIDVENEKSKDGYTLYKGICKECGYEKIGKLNYFKRRNIQECRHKNLLDEEKLKLWYEKNKKQCLYCGEYLPMLNLCFSEYKKRKFCNNSCATCYNNISRSKNNNEIQIIKKKEKRFCLNCGTELNSPNQKKYCSLLCQKEFQYKEYIEKWKSGEISGTVKDGASDCIKRYIKEKYNNQCCKCGWHEINLFTGNIPVEIHHVDGDYKNNKEENLELLCPNCHSLTATYKALNCGDGRKDRYK